MSDLPDDELGDDLPGNLQCRGADQRTINRRTPYDTIDQPRRARGRIRVRLGAGAIHRRNDQDRRDERHVGHLCRPERPGLGGGGANGGRGFRRRRQGHEGRDRRRRPPEQAGRRLQRRAHLDRRRQGRRDRRRADLVGGARGQRDRARQEQGLPGLRRGGLRSDRRQVHAQHDPLDLRHLGARQRHRQGDREDRRRHLVLPHRRLRLRPCARARHRGGGREERRQGAGQGPPSVPRHRLLVVPAAGAGLQGEDHRARQCRRRHHQLDQAGGRVRHRQGGQNLAGAAGLHHRRACARPADRPGPDLHRGLVLGPERRQSRIREEVRRAEQGRASDHDPCRRLFGGHALSQGGRGAQERRRRQGGGRQDEGDADRRQAVRQGHGARRRPQDPPDVSVRGQEAGRNRRGRGTTTRCAPPSRRTKPSGRWPRAAARW